MQSLSEVSHRRLLKTTDSKGLRTPVPTHSTDSAWETSIGEERCPFRVGWTLDLMA